MNENPEIQSHVRSPQEEVIRDAQLQLIMAVRSSVMALEAAVSKTCILEKSLSKINSRIMELTTKDMELNQLQQMLQITRGELREKERETAKEWKAEKNSPMEVYFDQELYDLDVAQDRAVHLSVQYEWEKEQAKLDVDRLLPRQKFLQTERKSASETVKMRASAFRDDFTHAFSQPSISTVLPDSYKQELEKVLRGIQPGSNAQSLVTELHELRLALHKCLVVNVIKKTPRPPRVAREDKEKIEVDIRWMIKRDMPEVVQMDALSFENAWDEEDFKQCFRQRNCIGLVAENNERILGYVVYELLNNKIRILNLAVHPAFRKHEIGSQIIQKILSKMAQQRRESVILEVRERNRIAQRFFQEHGFEATGILRSFYEDTDEDAYSLEYKAFFEQEIEATTAV